MEVSKEQQEAIERSRGITICGGMHTNTMRYSITKKDVETMEKLSTWADEAKAKGWSDFEEDETISCKDGASGVKCLKVKKGSGHFKPFYQNSRW